MFTGTIIVRMKGRDRKYPSSNLRKTKWVKLSKGFMGVHHYGSESGGSLIADFDSSNGWWFHLTKWVTGKSYFATGVCGSDSKLFLI